jgi:hypothetical protein
MVLENIFSKLAPADLGRVSQVCKRFCRVCQQQYIWKFAFAKRYLEVEKQELLLPSDPLPSRSNPYREAMKLRAGKNVIRVSQSNPEALSTTISGAIAVFLRLVRGC